MCLLLGSNLVRVSCHYVTDGTGNRCRIHSQPLDVAPDSVLLYKVTEQTLILVRTGSHSEVFECWSEICK